MVKKLSVERAALLLPDGDWIHVFVDPGEPEGEQWAKARVLRHFETYGVELSGEEAMKNQHGLVTKNSLQTIFVQTRKEPKV